MSEYMAKTNDPFNRAVKRIIELEKLAKALRDSLIVTLSVGPSSIDEVVGIRSNTAALAAIEAYDRLK